MLQRNIFCYSNPKATLFSTGKLSPGVISVDYNLYWHGGAEIRTGWGARETLAQRFCRWAVEACGVFVFRPGRDD